MNKRTQVRGCIVEKALKLLVIVLIVSLLVGCGDNKEEKTEKIEAYKAETTSHEDGDYKLVNS